MDYAHRNPRSYPRRSMFEKREKFFQLISTLHILWSEERFCRMLKNCSFEVNYLV
jgi:hypothetical protein